MVVVAKESILVLGEGQLLKDFEEAIIGMRKEQSKTFEVAFPADYHGKEDRRKDGFI